jgi:ParB/RepB/Spo0J family partition protein
MALDFGRLNKAIEKNRHEVTYLDPSRIDEDPDQPRKVFDSEGMDGLIGDIRQNGLKTPISVSAVYDERDYPTGRYIVNFGHRRLRAIKALGHDTIPCMIGPRESFDVQISENCQRENLRHMDLAHALARYRGQGMTRVQISEKLNLPVARISHLLGLLDMTDDIKRLWDAGLINDPKAVTALRAFRDKDPDAALPYIAFLLERNGTITQFEVEQHVRSLRSASPELPTLQGDAEYDGSIVRDPGPSPDAGLTVHDLADGETLSPDTGRAEVRRDASTVEATGPTGPAIAARKKADRHIAREDTAPGPDKIRNPRIDVSVEGLAGTLNLRRMARSGHVWVMFTDPRQEREVSNIDVRLEGIFENQPAADPTA